MKCSEQGYLTVEATIVFPTVFLSIMAVLWMSMTHCQNVMAASAAMRAASRAASCWEYAGGSNPSVFRKVDTAKNLITPASFTDHDPYRYLFDTGSGTRLANAGAYAARLSGEIPEIAGERDGAPRVVKTGGMLQKYIEVSVKKEYINPLEKIFESNGLDVDNNREVTARSPLNNPGEFVRNASIIYDLFKGDLIN